MMLSGYRAAAPPVIADGRLIGIVSDRDGAARPVVRGIGGGERAGHQNQDVRSDDDGRR